MPKTIKLTDETYNRLEDLRQKRETFSEAVGRLMDLWLKIEKVLTTQDPNHLGRGD